MPGALAARRLEVFAAARQRPAEFIRFDPSRLRFSLGTSLADVRVPAWLAPDAARLVEGAAAELALLLTVRHKAFVPSDELDKLYLRDDYAKLPQTPLSLGPAGGGADLKAAAAAGTSAHPALLGGVVTAWMGPGGRGRSLTALFIETAKQAFAEMAASRGREETPVVAALILTSALAGCDAALRGALPGPPVDRYLKAAALLGVWVAARTGFTRACREAQRGPGDPLALRLDALLNPLALLGSRANVVAGGATLYGCELSAGIPLADEAASRLQAGGEAEVTIEGVQRALSADEDLGRKAELAVAVARLRELLAAGIAAGEGTGPDAGASALRDRFSAPGALAAALAGEDERKALARELADAAGAALGDSKAALAEAAHAVKSARGKEPAAAFGLAREEAHRAYAEAAAAVLCDQALERIVGGARRAVELRTGKEAEGGADAEWEAGRLYRVTARGGPLLRSAQARPLGHLFVDVKDFTRRTGLVGGAAMADYLRREFYVPILEAAKRGFGGMDHLADKGGVAVNNLLGDALSLSGDIEAMVQTAVAIRELLAAYEQRLARAVSGEAVAAQLAEIEQRFTRQLEEVRRGLAQAREAHARAAPGSPEQAEVLAHGTRLAAEEQRLAADRERAVGRARGEGLEAGVFVSFGPAPLVVTIDDAVFGRQRVAIADKINESARGTARSPGARLRADALLAAERLRLRDQSVRHAWSVFVDQPLTVAVPPDAESAAMAAARAGDWSGALRAAAGAMRDALYEQATHPPGERRGDIYNNGAALSEEAMLAFLEAVGHARTIRRVTLLPEKLPAELRARFWFGDAQQLVVCFHKDGRVGELFRFAGRAVFKGLGEVPVWELCAQTGAPQALLRHFHAAWLAGNEL